MRIPRRAALHHDIDDAVLDDDDFAHRPAGQVFRDALVSQRRLGPANLTLRFLRLLSGGVDCGRWTIRLGGEE